MRTFKLLLFFCMFAALMGCEKNLVRESDGDREEYYDEDDERDDEDRGRDEDDDKKDGKGGNSDQDSSDGSKDDTDSGDKDDAGGGGKDIPDDSDDGWEEDPSMDDRETIYDETDIVDGNSQHHTDYQSGDTISVYQFIHAKSLSFINVKGYIVGTCTKGLSYADLKPPFDDVPALLIADSPDETNVHAMMPVKLYNDSMREQFNLSDHPDYYRASVVASGYRSPYFGIPGMNDSYLRLNISW